MVEKLRLFFNNKDLAYLFFLLILILLATFAELIGIASIPIFFRVSNKSPKNDGIFARRF